jgi:hypothetical protein
LIRFRLAGPLAERTPDDDLRGTEQSLADPIAGPDHLRDALVEAVGIGLVEYRVVERRIERLAHRPDRLEAKTGERALDPRAEHRDPPGPRVVRETGRHLGECAPEVIEEREEGLEDLAARALGVGGPFVRDAALIVAEVGSFLAEQVEQRRGRRFRFGGLEWLGLTLLAGIGHWSIEDTPRCLSRARAMRGGAG